MTGQNTILFLFDENDLKSSNNELLFVFGSKETSSCSYKILPINPSDNTISFDCGCTAINKNSNTITMDCNIELCIDYNWKEKENPIDFNIDCVKRKADSDSVDFNINCDCESAELIPVYLNNINSYFGINSETAFLIDLSAYSYFGFYGNINTIIVPDMRITAYSYFGYTVESTLGTIKYLYATSHIGWANTSSILYDQYNPFTTDIISYQGNQSSSLIVYDPYNELFDAGEYATSYIGVELQVNKFVYDPYNELFDGNEVATSYFGYDLKTNKFVYDPYNEFFTLGESGSFIFGQQLKSSIIFNPYNPFTTSVISHFGIYASSDIRYSDDPNINVNPMIFGYSANTALKYADTYANLGSSIYQGFTSNNIVTRSIGFIASSYIGYSGRLKYMILGRQSAIFNNCIATYGHEMHSNMHKIRYFDLSNTECCSIKHYPLRHIEMTDRYDVDVVYGLDKGWGFSSIVDLQTQPRFSSTFHVGFNAEVKDSSVYLGTCYAYIGIQMHTRGLQYSNNIDIGYGNFIIDQNEIKIEMTKPGDTFEQNYSFDFGFRSKVLFGAAYALNGNQSHYGSSSQFTLIVEEAWRAVFYFGYRSYGELNRQASFYPYSYVGFRSYASFYEAPYYMYYGFTSTCDALITENWVELLEEGELDNDYIFQNENGDPDLTRPTDVSIEGYPYTRYIKGRCY